MGGDSAGGDYVAAAGVDNGVGCCGVAVILRTGAGLLEAVLERVLGLEAEGGGEASGTKSSEEESRESVRPAVFEVEEVTALRSLVAGLTAGCTAAGERRVLRRVQATSARLLARLDVPEEPEEKRTSIDVSE